MRVYPFDGDHAMIAHLRDDPVRGADAISTAWEQ